MDLFTPYFEFQVIFEKFVFVSLQIWIVIILSILLICTIKRNKSTFAKLWCAYKSRTFKWKCVFKSRMYYRNLLRQSHKDLHKLRAMIHVLLQLCSGSIPDIRWNRPAQHLSGFFFSSQFCFVSSYSLIIVIFKICLMYIHIYVDRNLCVIFMVL